MLIIELLKKMTIHLASGVEAAAAVVIGLAALEATVRSLLLFLQHLRSSFLPQARLVEQQLDSEGRSLAQSEERIRLSLGRWMAVALEFELAADILRTAVAPTWNEIGQLAAIVVLRTVLNYFLQQEIDKAAVRNKPLLETIPR